MISDDINKKIKDSGKTLKEIAEGTGIPYSSLKQMKGQKNYKGAVMDKIAKFLEFEISILDAGVVKEKKEIEKIKEKLKAELCKTVDKTFRTK